MKWEFFNFLNDMHTLLKPTIDEDSPYLLSYEQECLACGNLYIKLTKQVGFFFHGWTVQVVTSLIWLVRDLVWNVNYFSEDSLIFFIDTFGIVGSTIVMRNGSKFKHMQNSQRHLICIHTVKLLRWIDWWQLVTWSELFTNFCTDWIASFKK